MFKKIIIQTEMQLKVWSKYNKKLGENLNF